MQYRIECWTVGGISGWRLNVEFRAKFRIACRDPGAMAAMAAPTPANRSVGTSKSGAVFSHFLEGCVRAKIRFSGINQFCVGSIYGKIESASNSESFMMP